MNHIVPEDAHVRKTFTHPHFKQKYSPVLRIHFKKIEMAPHKSLYFIECSGDSFEVQIQFFTKLFCLFNQNGKEQIFLILEELVDGPLGYIRILSNLRDHRG